MMTYELIIIGAGPAGLAAGIYAKRAGLEAIILEQNPISGGQVLNTDEVDNYPGIPGISGFELGMKFREHADKMECKFVEAVVQSIEEPLAVSGRAELSAAVLNKPAKSHYIIHTDKGDYETKALLAATGASYAKLQVPGEKELAGMGVSYCATCDGAFFRGRKVAVVGGGDVAVEDAIFLARTCEKVYLIHRRDELRAAPVLQESLKKMANVEILWNTVVDQIEGEEQVEGLKIRNKLTEAVNSLEVSGVFIAVGMVPNSTVFANLIPCDNKGYIVADEDGITGVPGIFAAGDVRTKKLRQVITAVADGANAAFSAQQYLLH